MRWARHSAERLQPAQIAQWRLAGLSQHGCLHPFWCFKLQWHQQHRRQNVLPLVSAQHIDIWSWSGWQYCNVKCSELKVTVVFADLCWLIWLYWGIIDTSHSVKWTRYLATSFCRTVLKVRGSVDLAYEWYIMMRHCILGVCCHQVHLFGSCWPLFNYCSASSLHGRTVCSVWAREQQTKRHKCKGVPWQDCAAALICSILQSYMYYTVLSCLSNHL